MGTFLPERLRPIGLIPDVRLFEFALDLCQAFGFAVVVKGTSSTHQRVR